MSIGEDAGGRTPAEELEDVERALKRDDALDEACILRRSVLDAVKIVVSLARVVESQAKRISRLEAEAEAEAKKGA